jgi:hypothetical protein
MSNAPRRRKASKELRALGWCVTGAGLLIAGFAGALMLYALVVPDSSGSPDARGMSFGASLAIFLLFGLPTILVGGVLLMLSEGDPPEDVLPRQ